jgi:hypothetical protein
VPYGTHIWQVADAPQLNGSFKIQLTKAKREYLKYKDPDCKKFVSSDCIPLINIAWSKSFSRIENARKAIMQRGWGPMNYVLLDHPKIIQLATKADEEIADGANDGSTAAATKNAAPTTAAVTDVSLNLNSIITETRDNSTFITLPSTTGSSVTINVDGALHNSLMGLLMLTTARGVGRKRKLEDEAKERERLKEQLDSLADLTRVTSGQLALRNHYLLCHQVLEKVNQKDMEEIQRQHVSDRKKMAARTKEDNLFVGLTRNCCSNNHLLLLT